MASLRATIFTLIALAGLSTALLKPRAADMATAPAPTTTLVKRVDPSRSSFYACDEAHWGGRCQWFDMPMGECLNFPLLWTDRISSFGPDPGYTYQVYIDSNCNGEQSGEARHGQTDAQPESGEVRSYQYPGVDNLKSEEGQWNDRISSVKCGLTDSTENQGDDPWLVTSTTLTTLYASCTTVTVNPRATYVLGKRSDGDDDGKRFCEQ